MALPHVARWKGAWVAAGLLATCAIAADAHVAVAGEVAGEVASGADDMADIPAGHFLMGNPNVHFGDADERPAHEVRLHAFRLARHAVTFAQYDAFARATGRALPADEGWGRGDRPVIHVSWLDAEAYVAWLAARTGRAYRLPTEAEWEYAARAGATSDFPWGEFWQDGLANGVGTTAGDAWPRTAPVGSFAPNAWGLFDMVGNVQQWVADCYREGYAGAPTDGSAVVAGDRAVAAAGCAQRVRRGGHWGLPAYFQRVDYRDSAPPAWHTDALGFRVAEDAPAVTATVARPASVAPPAAARATAGARSVGWLAPVGTANDPAIAGRAVALDAHGGLLPWPYPRDAGRSFASHALAQWAVLRDHLRRTRLPYLTCCFAIDPATGEAAGDMGWVNSTAYPRAMLEGTIERLWPYTGDASMLEDLAAYVDYEMEHGLTPAAGYQWPRVPYPSADPGAAEYSGWKVHGHDYVEPHLVGEDGYAYVRLYEMTGRTRYLEAAIGFADALARNIRPGDADHSPWPVRCLARDGRVEGPGMGEYSANVLGPITLFDELIRLGQGDVAAYARARAQAWRWLFDYPVRNDVWVGYFEDVVPSMGNMNSVLPLELARYLLLHPDADVQWRSHARALIDWAEQTDRWPKLRAHGALVSTEQGNAANFCCNKPGQCCDSHTARLAAAEALWFERTGERRARGEALRSLAWVSYFQGLPVDAHAPFSSQWWYTDEFMDGPRRLMDVLGALPAVAAPAGESHLLRSSSPVTRIRYALGRVAYSTFDADSEDVLRLDFTPRRVLSGGRQLAYSFDASSGVLRLHHVARDVLIEGEGGHAPWQVVDFDWPHRVAGTALTGSDAGERIQWMPGEWRIAAPRGMFGTFHIELAAPGGNATIRPATPRVLAGLEAWNPGPGAVRLALRCPGNRLVALTLGGGELRRLATGWRHPCAAVSLQAEGGAALHVDNIAFEIDPVVAARAP